VEEEERVILGKLIRIQECWKLEERSRAQVSFLDTFRQIEIRDIEI